MTKAERTVTQKHINKISEINEKMYEIFKEFQDLNAQYGSGKRWCSLDENYRDLMKADFDYTYLYVDYLKLEAQKNIIQEFATDLAETGFWK